MLLFVGCDSRRKLRPPTSAPTSVTVYCSVDPAFAEPILADFTKRSGITVYHVFDTEAGKTTGLVNKLVAEKSAPRADVWWSSEIFGTMQLAAAGVLESYDPKTAADVPQRYRDPGGVWTAVGLRGRVIAYDPSRTKKEDLPRRWCDLMQPKYKGRFRMADPRFGTTRGHMATLLSIWGEPAMKQFYEKLRENGTVLTDGNSQSVLHVTRGLADFAATDTDDIIAAKLQGVSIDMIYPDLDSPAETPKRQKVETSKSQNAESRRISGTLWIPCSAALLKKSPSPEAGKALIDYLVSSEAEEKLLASDSRNVPVRKELRVRLKADAPGEAVVDYAAAAKALESSDRLVSEVLLK